MLFPIINKNFSDKHPFTRLTAIAWWSPTNFNNSTDPLMCKCKNLSKISILFCYSYKFPIYTKIPFMNVSFAKASSSFDLLISISVIISCFTQNISLTSIPYPSLLLLILILGISKISMQSPKVISPLILAAVLLTKSENLLTTPACLKSCFVSFFF